MTWEPKNKLDDEDVDVSDDDDKDRDDDDKSKSLCTILVSFSCTQVGEGRIQKVPFPKWPIGQHENSMLDFGTFPNNSSYVVRQSEVSCCVDLILEIFMDFCKTTLFICFFPRQQQTRVSCLQYRFRVCEFDFEKILQEKKLDSALFQQALSSVRRHSFTRKNTFLSLNKTRERSGRVNQVFLLQQIAGVLLSHQYSITTRLLRLEFSNSKTWSRVYP